MNCDLHAKAPVTRCSCKMRCGKSALLGTMAASRTSSTGAAAAFERAWVLGRDDADGQITVQDFAAFFECLLPVKRRKLCKVVAPEKT